MRLYHLDLKTTMYRPEYIRKWFEKLKNNCYDGVVVEVDNKLIYPSHPDFAAEDALSAALWNELVKYGKELGLTIYPLLQTLGHMEHILLSSTNYHHLAENPGNPYMLCPSKAACLTLIKDLIDDLAVIFESPKFIHLGGDEVFGHMDSKGLKKCPRCSSEDPSKLLLDYLLELAKHCIEKNIRPEFWADEILTYPEILDKFPSQTRFVDWLYTRTEEYTDTVTHLWGARYLNKEKVTDELISKIPENLRVLLPFMFDKQGRFDNFYGVKYIRSKGYDVSIGSGVRFYGDTYELPRIDIGIKNVGASEKVAANTGSAHMVTSWAVRYSHPETTWPSLNAVECANDQDSYLKPLGDIGLEHMDLIKDAASGFYNIDIPFERFARFERPYYDEYMLAVNNMACSKEKENIISKLEKRISSCRELISILENRKQGDPDCIKHWLLGTNIALLRSRQLLLMLKAYEGNIDLPAAEELLKENIELMAIFGDIYRESVTEHSMEEEKEIKFKRDIRILENLICE